MKRSIFRSESNRRVFSKTALASIAGLTVAGCESETESNNQSDRSFGPSNIAILSSAMGAGTSLASNTPESLKAQIAVTQGAQVPFDGGGGLYVWDNQGAMHNGGTIIVPGATEIGQTGACWRRVN